jgi:hypothetical protein
LWSREKISRGERTKGIFLNFKAGAGLTVSCSVGDSEPKMIPHVFWTPYVQEHTLTLYLRLFCTKMYTFTGLGTKTAAKPIGLKPQSLQALHDSDGSSRIIGSNQ